MMEEGKDMKPVTCEEKSIHGSERDGKDEYTEGRSQKQVGQNWTEKIFISVD